MNYFKKVFGDILIENLKRVYWNKEKNYWSGSVHGTIIFEMSYDKNGYIVDLISDFQEIYKKKFEIKKFNTREEAESFCEDFATDKENYRFIDKYIQWIRRRL